MVDAEEHSQVLESETTGKRRFLSPKKYIYYVDYICHRNGPKRDQVAENNITKGCSSGQNQDLQKASKKIICTAKIKVICLKVTPLMWL